MEVGKRKRIVADPGSNYGCTLIDVAIKQETIEYILDSIMAGHEIPTEQEFAESTMVDQIPFKQEFVESTMVDQKTNVPKLDFILSDLLPKQKTTRHKRKMQDQFQKLSEVPKKKVLMPHWFTHFEQNGQ